MAEPGAARRPCGPPAPTGNVSLIPPPHAKVGSFQRFVDVEFYPRGRFHVKRGGIKIQISREMRQDYAVCAAPSAWPRRPGRRGQPPARFGGRRKPAVRPILVNQNSKAGQGKMPGLRLTGTLWTDRMAIARQGIIQGEVQLRIPSVLVYQ